MLSMQMSGILNGGSSPTAAELPSLTTQLLTVAILVLRRTVHHRAIHTQRTIQNSYDYIVVGAGTSGSVVAGRLSENSARSVLVLEAGGPQTVVSDAPGIARQQFGSEIDWGYRTVPQSPYAGNAFRDGGRIAIPRGRIVGGSHNMNFLVYSRGSHYDFDSWAEPPFNARGWSYADVLPYFMRSENNTDPRIVNANPGYHSTSGPVVVQTPATPDPIIEIMKNVLLSEAHVPLVDQNGPGQLGINNFQQTIFLNGTRATTASAFLEANVNRTNLQVLTRAFVTRILFNGTAGTDLRAIGVEYVYQNETRQVYANLEVILSAGSINTPQLLMLNGIGPQNQLEQLGITTRVDLPVGQNLMDHVFVQLDFEVLDQNLITADIRWNLQTMFQNFAQDSGPLAQLPLVYLYANSRLNNQTDYPDIQVDFEVVPVSDDLDILVENYEPNTQNQWRDYYRPHVGARNRLGVLCFLYRPRSVGQLTLQNTNPYTAPNLDMQYLTDEYDIRALMDAIRTALIITHRPPFSRMLRMWRQPIPGCTLCTSGPIWECDAYLECYARALTATVGHQVGTARMADASNPTAVVDPQLRVIGVQNLRVVDGSIYPRITNGNTNTPCMMFGELGAELIAAAHR